MCSPKEARGTGSGPTQRGGGWEVLDKAPVCGVWGITMAATALVVSRDLWLGVAVDGIL